MIAYNEQSLDRLTARKEAMSALKKRLIPAHEYDAIDKSYKADLYSPNIFIRIGLFAATVVIVLMTFGLILLIFGSAMGNESVLFVISLFFACAIYAVLEWIIQNKKHYRSGVDDGLLWLAFICIVADIGIYFEPRELWISLMIFALSLAATIRFANSVMSAVMFCSFIATVFYGLILFGSAAKPFLPFVIMLLAFLVYVLIKSIKLKHSLRYYQFCFAMLEVLSLITIYASVNYFAVRELSIAMFNMPESASVTGGWFFWMCTFAVPVIYIVKGLQAKDHLILRVGLLLIAAGVFTFRYYYSIAPIEQLLTVSGIILIVLAYACIRYLQTARNGISDSHPRQHPDDGLNVESLVIAETFNEVPAPDEGFRFGGGSTGGGGATGQF